MSDIALKVEGIYKRYRLGLVDSNAFKEDLIRFWAKLQGKPDPFESYITANELANVTNQSEITSRYIWALQDINFEVKQGEILGVIGKNGAGKSTLLKLLSKTTAPTKGQIKVKGRIASLLEVGTGFHPELTGRQNIFLNGMILGMRKHEVKKYLDEIIDFAGIEAFIDTPVKRYSSGMYVRLGFAVAAHLLSDILIVDEVLAVGDAEFQKKCIGKMKGVSQAEGRTVLFVSHNMETIKKLCPSSILMKNGQILSQGESEPIISQYITANYQKTINGRIPETASTYCTGQVKFTHISILNSNGKESSTWFCGKPFIIKARLKVFEKLIGKIVVNMVLSNDSDTRLINLNSDFSMNELDEGNYEIEIFFDDILTPNKYYVSLGIHDMTTGGLSLDWVENIISFEVYADKTVYPFNIGLGFMNKNNALKINKI